MAASQRPRSSAEKATHTTVDTIGFTVEEAKEWIVPQGIQRNVNVNKKVMELASVIKSDGGVIPGIITLGILDGKTYLVDGQQRREAFFISEREYGYADVRKCFFKSWADMGEEFVRLNGHLVNMSPDDILRGLEHSCILLKMIRENCPFVGYGRVRINGSQLMISMSTCLRCWANSRKDNLTQNAGSSLDLARSLQEDEAKKLVKFLKLAYAAWGADPEYWRMWGSLNLTICMWLFRRLVTDPPLGQHRSVRLNEHLFQVSMTSLTASRSYLDWLLGRNMNNRDRSPCYARVKKIFQDRLHEETGTRPLLPKPEWCVNT